MSKEEFCRFLRDSVGETLFEAEFGDYFKSEGNVDTTSISNNDPLQVAPPMSSLNTSCSGAGSTSVHPPVNGTEDSVPLKEFTNRGGFATGNREDKNRSGATGYTGDSQQPRVYEPRFIVMVPASNCGGVIGCGGSNIKKLQEKYNVKRFMLIREQEADGFRPLVVQTSRELFDKAVDCVISIMELVSIEVDGKFEIHLSGADVVRRVESGKAKLEKAEVPLPRSMNDKITILDGNTREELADRLKQFLTILYGTPK